MRKGINTNELKAEVVRKGMTLGELAEIIGLSWSGFWKKTAGQNSFTLEEVRAIRDALNLDDKAVKNIFLI
jgi:cyanate lyase